MPSVEKIKVKYQDLELTVALKSRMTADHLLLFLHGLGCAKESFDAAFNTESLNPYALCALDFPGFGASETSDDFPYMLEDHARITQQVLDRLSPKTVSIIAHSMGGAIGLLLAQKLSNLEQFINVEGNLIAEDCGLMSRSVAAQSIMEFESQGYENFLNRFTSSERQDLRAIAPWYQQANPKAIHASARSLVAWSDSGQLLEIFNALQNKAYIYGDEEPKDDLLPRLQNTKVHYIPKLKHFMMIEAPDLFFDAISKVLERSN